MRSNLSIVIPTLNAAKLLADTLESLLPNRDLLKNCSETVEVIVIDGGSSDSTVSIARKNNTKVLSAPQGRGPQLKAGAEAASGAWLLFLHADTRLASGWHKEVFDFIKMEQNTRRAGVFQFALDDYSLAARCLQHAVRLRCNLFSLPYGDQGLLIHRDHYLSIGGFRPIPLMEDIDLVRRIGRKNITFLHTQATTSAARYKKYGYLPRIARNATCIILFYLGIRAEFIARLYG